MVVIKDQKKKKEGTNYPNKRKNEMMTLSLDHTGTVKISVTCHRPLHFRPSLFFAVLQMSIIIHDFMHDQQHQQKTYKPWKKNTDKADKLSVDQPPYTHTLQLETMELTIK